jgi:hypothetical protein
MNTTISPLRRITVTLALTGAAAFSAVAVAPSAFADDSVAPVTSVTVPAVGTAPVAPPPVVLNKDGKPVKAPKTCSDKDIAESDKKVADAKKKVAPLFALATKAHVTADAVRAQEVKLTTAKQVAAAEAVANGLDMVGDKLADQAQATIDKAAILDCFIVEAGGRF